MFSYAPIELSLLELFFFFLAVSLPFFFIAGVILFVIIKLREPKAVQESQPVASIKKPRAFIALCTALLFLLGLGVLMVFIGNL